MVHARRLAATFLVVGLLAGAAAGCAGASAQAGPTVLQVWRHAGTPEELATLDRQVAEFNRSRADVRVELRTIPEGDYNDVLQTASAGNTLPDVVEVDGPTVASYVYQERLQPLDDLVPRGVLDDQLPSVRAQATVGGSRYAVSVFDSGLGIYADRRALEKAGVRWPTGIDDAWTEQQLDHVLQRLAAVDDDGLVLDLKRNYGASEWLTYGFAPLVASAGGELVDPGTLSPEGHLDGRAARHALGALARWSPYVDPNDEDDAFPTRRVALSWVGHWAYPAYREALGDDLLVLPLPDLGHGTKTGQGSWAWAVSAPSSRSTAAGEFLAYLLRDREVLRMTDANGAVPGTRSALARSSLYQPDGPLRLFAEQLLRSCGTAAPDRSCVAVPRPMTPGYPRLSAQFGAAVTAALDGGDVAEALADATVAVSEDLAANDGFR